jgi:hypothetical protein
MLIRLAVLASCTTLLFGPPSIRVEAVANPATAPVKGAVFMITGRHHGATEGFSVTGRAEGLVAGKRVSHPLTLIPAAGSPGVYGVTRQWDAGEAWVLVFSVDDPDHGDHGWAEAAVRIAANGRVMGIDYPLGKWDATPWPRRVAAAEIDAALAAMTSNQ